MTQLISVKNPKIFYSLLERPLAVLLAYKSRQPFLDILSFNHSASKNSILFVFEFRMALWSFRLRTSKQRQHISSSRFNVCTYEHRFLICFSSSVCGDKSSRLFLAIQDYLHSAADLQKWSTNFIVLRWHRKKSRITRRLLQCNRIVYT